MSISPLNETAEQITSPSLSAQKCPAPPIIDKTGSTSPRAKTLAATTNSSPSNMNNDDNNNNDQIFLAHPAKKCGNLPPPLPPKIVKKIIIDTDCGGDDALGVLVAAADPQVEIVMLTAVWGNCDVHQGVENLGKLVDVIGKDIPIYVGAKGPLMGQERETSQWYGYGQDGFGDAGFDHSSRSDRAERSGKHAALAIVDVLSALSSSSKSKSFATSSNNNNEEKIGRGGSGQSSNATSGKNMSRATSFSNSSATENFVANELKELVQNSSAENEDTPNSLSQQRQPQEMIEQIQQQQQETIEVWQLFCLGPLTNIATALQLDPKLFACLGSAEHEIPGVIIMGGAMHGKGNANLSSEFNFASDPEAARTVFNNRSSPVPYLVVTWELTVDLALPWEVFDSMLGRMRMNHHHNHHEHKDVNQQNRNNNNNNSNNNSSLATENHEFSNNLNAVNPKSYSTATDLPHSDSNDNVHHEDHNDEGEKLPDETKSTLQQQQNSINFAAAAASSSSVSFSPLERSNSHVRNPRLQSFLIKLLKKFEETSRPADVETGDEERTQDSCVICDAVCVAVGLNAKDCIAESNKTFATVELHGSETRGALCVDWYGNEQSRKKKGRWVNAEIVLKAKHNLVNEIIGGITVVTNVGV